MRTIIMNSRNRLLTTAILTLFQLYVCLGSEELTVLSPTWSVEDILKPDENHSPNPQYHPDPILSENLIINGSSFLENLATMWTKALKPHHPQLSVNLQITNTKSGLIAIAKEQAHLALLSRPYTIREIQDFSGLRPKASLLILPIGFEAIRILVHGDNPVPHLSTAQLRDIFSDSSTKNLLWSEVGGGKNLGAIVPMSREPHRGAGPWMKEYILGSHTWNSNLKHANGSISLRYTIAGTPNGITFTRENSTITNQLRCIPIIPDPEFETSHTYYSPKEKKAFEPHGLDLHTGYPLLKYHHVAIAVDKNIRLPNEVLEFIKFIYSPSGQRCLAKDGLHTLPMAARKACLQFVLDRSK